MTHRVFLFFKGGNKMAKPAFYIEGIPVYQDFMKESYSNYPAKIRTPKSFTVHETENYDVGADAEMHNRYLHNQAWGRQASWTFTVDSEKIYQHAPINRTTWHAGDGSGPGNTNSIGIEHCENEDGDFEKTVRNGQALIRFLSKQTGIPLSETYPHNKWSGKNCPNNILPFWDKYKDTLDDKVASKEPVKVPKPKKPKNNTNNSIVDYLNSIGVDSSFTNRKKLAAEYGVSNYRGTASQNLELLHKMRDGDMPSRNEEPKTSGYKGTSIVDYLNSIGENSSFSNRKKLASKYGISNYKGTASQNTQLLNKMRGSNKPAASKPTKIGNQTTTSIVDYLKSINKDSSFSNRKRLAEKYGIKNYRGTAAQNSQLLKKLRG